MKNLVVTEEILERRQYVHRLIASELVRCIPSVEGILKRALRKNLIEVIEIQIRRNSKTWNTRRLF